MPKYFLSFFLLLVGGSTFGQSKKFELALTRMEVPPYGDLVFANGVYAQDYFTSAEKTLSQDYKNILGTPDAVKTGDSFFKLTKGKSIILSFAEFPFVNSIGPDIFIFCDENPDNLLAFISENGKKWLALGVINSKKKHLNLSGKPDPSVVYRFLKLKNISEERRTAGIEIDAVALRLPAGAKRYYPITADSIVLRGENPILRTRDFRKADGDRVMLYLNNEKVRDIYLSKLYAKYELNLTPGAHEVYIQALNTGKIFPNTFSLEIVDDDKVYFKEMRLTKGKGIRINLIRAAMNSAGT